MFEISLDRASADRVVKASAAELKVVDGVEEWYPRLRGLWAGAEVLEDR